jgi:hypothetical protein
MQSDPIVGQTPRKLAFHKEGLTILCGHLLFPSTERLQSENHAGRGYATLAMAMTFVRPPKNLPEDTRNSKEDLSTVTVFPWNTGHHTVSAEDRSIILLSSLLFHNAQGERDHENSIGAS